MISFSGEEVQTVFHADSLHVGVKEKGKGVCTDTRTLQKGELFFALKGPHFDGNRFCEDAVKKGAWGVVVDRKSWIVNRGSEKRITNHESQSHWIFEVKDTLTALGDLAAWWRKKFSIPCVAITGSNGKTTTKEMVASILGFKGAVLKTEGNFNNLIGLPLTISRWENSHRYAVLEMGMSDFGEIKRLTEIAAPTVGCVTNVAAAHLEKLGEMEDVARAKGEMFSAMNSSGMIVVNAEDPLVCKKAELFRGKKIFFGMQKHCEVRFEHWEQKSLDEMFIRFSIQGRICEVLLPFSGFHNVMNCLAAAAVALAVSASDVEILQGLQKIVPLKMRFEQVQLANGVRLVNDCYNANPGSMEMAFRTVGSAKRAGRFIAVLGDMLELGGKSPELHRDLGKKAVEHGANKLFLVGSFSKNIAEGAISAGILSKDIVRVEKKEDLNPILEKEVKKGDVVLVKASRGMGLETVAHFLKDTYGI